MTNQPPGLCRGAIHPCWPSAAATLRHWGRLESKKVSRGHQMPHKSEAFDDLETPSLTPISPNGAVSPPQTASRGELHLDKGQVADLSFERPFYEMIVDGIHSHPNSVRV